ncbi:MAG: ATPase domain-containing protein [Candidatus Diapherotrites archaeon]
MAEFIDRFKDWVNERTKFLGGEKKEIKEKNPAPRIDAEFEDSLILFDNFDKSKTAKEEVLPARVSKFDGLIMNGGIERGSTILISGGAGTGKTTFGLQSLYNGVMNGEKGIYISFEEEPKKIKKHMLQNFGWDLQKLETEGKLAVLKFDPTKIARSMEEEILKTSGGLRIPLKRIRLPFIPDKIVVDSLSALSIAFDDKENYRKYIRKLFETFERINSVNFVLAETEQDPTVYSRTGTEEFLADGVVVLYNLKKNEKRENALEILKLRSSNHVKKMVPYKISDKGIEIIG